MVYRGFLRIGGVDVVNTERARGYMRTADCPSWMIKDDVEPSINQALFEEPWVFENIALAPWFDQSLPDVSSRFFGVYGVELGGIGNSTREASITEGVGPGGVIGRSRKGVKQTRVRATLLARGDDALDYGKSWLNSVFDGACSQHGNGCGTTDMEFFAAVPPERGQVPDFTAWEPIATDVVVNPSMEAAGASVAVRTNLIRYSDTTSPTGWTPTATGSTLSEGGRLKFTSNGASVVRLGGITQLAGFKAAGTYLVSFRAQAMDAALTGVRIYLYDSATTNIRATFTAPTLAGDQKYETLLAATGVFDRVYMEFYGTAIPSGAVGYISEPLLELSTVARPFFNGTQRSRLRRNLAKNPRGTVTSGWQSNSAPTNPVTRGVVPPVPHPMGIETAVEQSSTGTNSALITLYNLDSLVNTGTPARMLGVWVLITEPGYVSYGVPIPANVWTFVRRTDLIAAGGYATFFANKSSGSASTTVRAYITGALVEEGTAPVGEYFDGGIGATDGYGTAWDSTVLLSSSYIYDSDLTPAWTGAASASESVLQGASVAGYTPGGVVAFQSARWRDRGTKSMRIRPTGVLGSTYVIARALTGADAGKVVTLIATVHIETPLAANASAYARSFFIATNAATPNYQGPQVPNTPGVHELRWTTVLPADMTNGSIRFYHGNAAGDADIWIDSFGVIEGSYEGYFDGDTGDTDFDRYNWVGLPNASASVHESREAIMRPQTDLEYAASVNPLRRFMHSVGVTSGPIVIEDRVSANGLFNVLTVEWTITAERPWVYSTTRPVELPTTETTLIQDVPYNLIPYPSAEVTSGDVVVATNFATNPSVEVNATGWSATKSTVPGTMVGARVTGELRAQGAASFRGLFTPGVTNLGTTYVAVEQTVNISTRPANTRISISMWAAITADGTTVGYESPSIFAEWLDGSGNILDTEFIGILPSDITPISGALSKKSLLPPVGTTQVRVRASAAITGYSADTVVRIYADALAVTAP